MCTFLQEFHLSNVLGIPSWTPAGILAGDSSQKFLLWISPRMLRIFFESIIDFFMGTFPANSSKFCRNSYVSGIHEFIQGISPGTPQGSLEESFEAFLGKTPKMFS